MKRLAAIALVFFALSCTQDRTDSRDLDGHVKSHGSAPDQAMFRPEQVPWKDGPASLPAGAKVAILEGDPAKAGYFAMRLKFPDGYRVPPHWHPNVERVTIISGTLHLGMGDSFDQGAAHTLPAGSYGFMPPGMRHFAWTEGETVLQLATVGPWEINYVNPSDDPRRQK
jgi:quercetin dioxygenase-like cupin family protein